MKYYFKVIDNKIDSSYIFNENEIADLFPGQDVTINTPSGFIEYKPHTPVIPLKPYEKINIVGYEFVDDNTVTDIIEILPMTLEEKLQKQENVKTQFYNRTGRYTWVLNEEHCIMEPPFMPPLDEWSYRWDEPTQSYINMNITKIDYLKQNYSRNAN
jgi:hypothetical protein